MSPNQTNCPTWDTLASFAIGQLSESLIDSVAKHVDECDVCNKQLATIELSTDDRLLADLKVLPAISNSESKNGQRSVPRVPDELIKAAEEVLTTAHAKLEIVLDSGYKLARKLKESNCSLGRYELISELGVGTFGHVFKARDPELDRVVALKVQRAGLFASSEDAERFLREARNVAQLNHPGIVSIYDTGTTDEVCFLVTEFVEGTTLEELLATESLELIQALHIVIGICDSLQYAHEKGVIHRDIKPSNIILDQNGRPYLMDFGLAKREFETGNTMTSDGRVMGTPAYMSPEQARGDSHYVDARSDIFSIGVLLYELLTNERPFQGKNRMLLVQVVEDNPRPPKYLSPKIPWDLNTICMKALEKSKRNRYQSADELREDLQRFVDGLPIKAQPPRLHQRFFQWCYRYPVAASLLLTIPLITLGGFAHLSFLSKDFVHNTALESAKMEADMLEDINDFYSENVVGHLDRSKISVTHEYTNQSNAIPLPFTFMIDAGHKITAGKSGTKFNIYSSHPWRTDGGPSDDFENRALNNLSVQSKAGMHIDSFHEFTSESGKPVLRYARAQTMKQSCVQCHNDHPSSPKRDWVEGDLAGVLAITRPLDRDESATRSKLFNSFRVIGGLATFLFVSVLSAFWIGRSKHANFNKVRANA